MHRIKIIPLVTILSVLNAGHLSADLFNWNNANGGDFGTLTNWTPAPSAAPGSSDIAAFGASAPVVANPITSNVDRQLSGLRVNESAFTFDFNGNTLSVGSPIIGVNGLSANVTFTDGDYQFTGASSLGGNSVLKVSGSTASLTHATNFTIGYVAGTELSPYSPQLLIQSGAQYTATVGNLRIGGQVDHSVGLLRVTGAGTTASFGTSNVAVGSSDAQTGNSGTLKIDAGAKATGGNSIRIGAGAGVTGSLIVEGDGSSLTTGSVSVGGSASASGGTGTMLVHSGGSVTGSGALYNWKNGTVYVGAGSRLSFDTIRHGSGTAGDEAAVLKGSGTIVATNPSATTNMLMYGEIRPGDTNTGNGIGTLTLGETGLPALVRAYGTSTSYFDFDGVDEFDKITIIGSLNGSSNNLGTLVLNFNFAPGLEDTFTFLTASSFGGTPAYSEIVWQGFATGGEISYLGNSITVSNITVIPEPATYALLGGSLAMMLLSKRRGRHGSPAGAISRRLRS